MAAPVLSSDIQLALQHAVIEANNAFAHSSNVDQPKKNKKKRGRENADASLADQTLKKAKQKMQHDEIQERVTEDVRTEVPVGESARSKKKKRRKDKGKAPACEDAAAVIAQPSNVSPPPDQLSSPLEANSQPLTTAFLSAIVAAASATLDSNVSPQTDIENHLQPHQSPQPDGYLSVPPVQYPYPASQFAHPTNGPIPPTLPVSEMSFGSAEDILRMLQDIDISKIANVLKTLTDAAAAANVSLGPQSTFVQPQSTQGFPLGRIPLASDAIMAQPGSHIADQQSNVPSSSGQGVNKDHAQLLSTKWMNASKLAELVKTQGT